MRSTVFIVNFEQISHFGISIVDFEEVNAGWVEYELQITDFDVTGYTITQGMRGHIKKPKHGTKLGKLSSWYHDAIKVITVMIPLMV